DAGRTAFDQALREHEGALLAADVGVGTGQRGHDGRVLDPVTECGFGAGQRQLRFAAALALHERARLGGLHL
ncbi:hypothetical protein RRF55_28995, partial [Klebsiella sp. K47]|uniref:hypothetical protein n=1 Tax=Klebsiella sp. K47 TaxID=3077736 RepID=UPI003F455C5D